MQLAEEDVLAERQIDWELQVIELLNQAEQLPIKY